MFTCVAHACFLMDRIATHILAFTGEDRALGEGVAIEGGGVGASPSRQRA